MKLGPLWRSFFKLNINHEGNSRRSKEQLSSQEDEGQCSLTYRIPSVFVFKNLYFIVQKLYFILDNIWAWAAVGTPRRSLKCTDGGRWAERRRTESLPHKSLLFPFSLVRVLHLLVKGTQCNLDAYLGVQSQMKMMECHLVQLRMKTQGTTSSGGS